MHLNKTVKVTKIFTFEMAHALWGYDGECRNIHGHSYKLHVTLVGSPLQQPGHPKDGMVIDFKQLKTLIKKIIISPYDHALLLSEQTPDDIIASLKEVYQKIIRTSFQPTCENLVLKFAQEIQHALPEDLVLSRLKLYETATSYAEWEPLVI